jgi:hypothetical protein
MMGNVQKKSCLIPDLFYGLTLPKILHLKILSHSLSNKILKSFIQYSTLAAIMERENSMMMILNVAEDM